MGTERLVGLGVDPGVGERPVRREEQCLLPLVEDDARALERGVRVRDDLSRGLRLIEGKDAPE
jgi:hypothetical protein